MSPRTRNWLLALLTVGSLTVIVRCFHPQDDQPPASDHEVGDSRMDFDTGAVVPKAAHL